MFLKHTFVNPGGSKSKNWSFRQKEKSNFVFEGVLNTDFFTHFVSHKKDVKV